MGPVWLSFTENKSQKCNQNKIKWVFQELMFQNDVSASFLGELGIRFNCKYLKTKTNVVIRHAL